LSQHEDEVTEQHRPVRRRHAHDESASAPEPLQIVETAGAAVEPATFEDELPRRTKPRRRRSVAIESGPLQIIETEAGAEATPSDNPTAQ
jgi:hypothetical protein